MLFKLIRAGRFYFDSPYWDKISEPYVGCGALQHWCIPMERRFMQSTQAGPLLGGDATCMCCWFDRGSAKNLIRRMLVVNPSERITADEVGYLWVARGLDAVYCVARTAL